MQHEHVLNVIGPAIKQKKNLLRQVDNPGGGGVMNRSVTHCTENALPAEEPLDTTEP